MNPSGAAQPSLQQAYETKGNPAETEPAEKASAEQNAQSNAGQSTTETRVPTKQTSYALFIHPFNQTSLTATPRRSIDEATPSSLGQGVHGAPPGEEAKGKTDEDVGRSNELDGAQMAAPGEGDVADIVDRKPGATGGEESLTTDLDRKKAEQAPAREAAKAERKEKVDVAGILAQRSAPADPTN